MSGPDYHAWTHRSKELGGTDPIPVDLWPNLRLRTDQVLYVADAFGHYDMESELANAAGGIANGGGSVFSWDFGVTSPKFLTGGMYYFQPLITSTVVGPISTGYELSISILQDSDDAEIGNWSGMLPPSGGGPNGPAFWPTIVRALAGPSGGSDNELIDSGSVGTPLPPMILDLQDVNDYPARMVWDLYTWISDQSTYVSHTDPDAPSFLAGLWCYRLGDSALG